jgi:signal transduction histidine kinase
VQRATVVFVSHTRSGSQLLRAADLVLLIVLLAGGAAAVFLTNRLAGSVTKPIRELCARAERIGRGEFSAPPVAPCDIEELDILNRSFLDMAERLASYDAAQKAFLQNASHELKTPLMSIQGYAEGIRSGIAHDTARAADIIIAESRRLNALVEELLTLSRIENGAYGLTPLDLRDVMKEQAQRLQGLAAKQERQLLLRLPDEGVTVSANDELLSQIVMNLASNCLRYAKTTVEIELRSEGKAALIRVGDDGGGIAEEDLPHIFERFYKGKGGKTGLGLAIAKSAAEAMGGRLSAGNGDSGAVFEFRLPLAAQGQ